MGGAVLGQMVLDATGKQAEQARENKPGSSTPSWFLLQVLPASSCFGLTQECAVIPVSNTNKPFPAQDTFAHGLYPHSYSTKLV